jgi:hypothetical protein
MKEIKDLLRKLFPILKTKTKALWYFLVLSKDKSEMFENIQFLRLIADKEAKADFKRAIRLPPPNPELLTGDYNLGRVLYPESEFSDFGLREEEFSKHILLCGMTGTGKTNLSFIILRELAKHNKPFLVFDWKRNYKNLKRFPAFKNIKVIRPGDESSDFSFNPLIPPPGISHQNWMTILIDCIKHAFFVAYGPEYFFRKGLNILYGQFGVYNGNKEHPTFNDLEKLLRKEYVRGRELLWMNSVKRVLACLTSPGILGKILNVRTHESISNLLIENVIFELDNLANLERIFLIEALLLWIYHYRKSEEKQSDFKHAIILEEAHHILSGKKEAVLGEETIIETMIRMIREYGESIIVIDQEPSKLSKSILANTNCKISFNLGHGLDIRAISQSMNLEKEQEGFIDLLPVGHAILKLKHRFSEPIHIKFPLISLKNI